MAPPPAARGPPARSPRGPRRRRAGPRSPWPCGLLLVRRDGGLLLQEEAELVDAVEQAAAGKGIDGEGDPRLVEGEGAGLEIDADADSRRAEQHLGHRDRKSTRLNSSHMSI